MTAIVLFRRDLRLADNPALAAACLGHKRVIPLYIHEQSEPGWTTGAASRWWLHHSLAEFQKRLNSADGALNICRGETLPLLLDLAQRYSACAVYWNRRYEPADMERDAALEAVLSARGIAVHSYPGSLWLEPTALLTQAGEPYKVFTPFWRKLRAQLEVALPLSAPRVRHCVNLPDTVALTSLDLLPKVAWDDGFHEMWQPGEQGAQRAVDEFATAAGRYVGQRDYPGRRGTSRLSPHLHFGEITPRQVAYALETRIHGQADGVPDTEPFLRQLGWREFAHYLLFHFPRTPEENFNPRFDRFRWAPRDDAALQRWQQGRTGIPLVDAGMRELWYTGWMHNRVRMVVASFLTKNLRQHWLLGARWFWDTLVDADLANNTLGWQWVAGSGADAAPYFRIFNPTTQGRKFDPEGVYLRRWLPELAGLPPDALHEPWREPSALRRSGYPAPMLDLARSRQEALAAYRGVAA